MKTSVKVVGYLEDNTIGFIDKNIEDVVITFPTIMAIDGSTTRTGVSLLRESDGAFVATMAFEREKATEKPVQYKVRLKKQIEQLLKNNKQIRRVYYEEPFLGYASAAPNLMMLRVFIEELICENEPDFDYIQHYEVPNKRWKKIFLAPDKCPGSTELEKKAVKDKLVKLVPLMESLSQDEIDAAAMGFAVYLEIKNGTDENLVSKEKVRPFLYEMTVIGADDDDIIGEEFWDIYKGPKSITENGIRLVDLPKRANFDKFVYQSMGNEDKVLILKFDSNTHSNIILEHRLGHLAEEYDYLYAIVWRRTRKAKH